MKSALAAILVGILFIPAPLSGQQRDENTPAPIVGWLADFSNLPGKTRAEYIELFTQAKQAYASGNWAVCYALLSQCEFIYDKNPHVWNLRTVCLIAQKKFTEAEQELNKAKAVLPHDETTLMNIANLHMGKGEFRQCIEVINNIIQSGQDSLSPELTDILTFRICLCHLMLGERKAAKQLVSHLTPISDTPLYYYSQAAMHISRGNRTQAREDILAANTIFASGGATLPYIRALQTSGLEEKYLK